jgi:molybdopterin adenylyltransferase
LGSPLIFGILTLSDRSAAGQRPDLSAPALVQRIQEHNWQVLRQAVLPDDLPTITAVLASWADTADLDVILTTGGTGFSPRDVTPEATLAVIQRLAPGIAEAIRLASLRITPHAMLSRGVAGLRGSCLIVNLPGSPKGALESLDVILPVLPHAVQLLHQDPAAESGHAGPATLSSGDDRGSSA